MNVFKKYLVGMLVPFGFVGSLSGCSSSGYRPKYESSVEQKTNIIAQTEYQDISIEDFVAREIAFIESNTAVFARNNVIFITNR